MEYRLTNLQKNLFLLSVITVILEKKLRKSLEKIDRRFGNTLTLLMSILTFGGIYLMLPNWPMFMSLDDLSYTKGKVFFTGFVTTLVCESINKIGNRERPAEREKKFKIIILSIIGCVTIGSQM